MEVSVQTVVIINLELTQEEAWWLNQIMQNPLHDAISAKEDPVDRAMRERFFNATKAAQVR